MDPSIAAAGRALRAGDPLGALRRVALRGDPAALALRGIAMAQLGELRRARELLRSARRGFGPRDERERARCLAAEAEVALAARDLAWAARALPEAVRAFEARGDRENATHARLLEARRLLLLGRVEQASGAIATLALEGGPPRLEAAAALVAFELALRQGRAGAAREALARARDAGGRAGIGALRAEVEQAGRALALPSARLVTGGAAQPITLAQVEELLGTADLVVDGCRKAARRGRRVVPLARRPVLFALLADGEAWSASSLALALGTSQRTAQRALATLAQTGQVRAVGRGRSRRWLSAPVTGFATSMLLPGAGGPG